jgi:hypothetical protein
VVLQCSWSSRLRHVPGISAVGRDNSMRFSEMLYLENTYFMGTERENTSGNRAVENRARRRTQYLTVEAERITMLEENVAQYTGPVVIKSEVSGLPGKSACERRESPAGSGPPAIRLPEGPVLAELLEVKKRPSRVRFCPRYVITPLLYSDCFVTPDTTLSYVRGCAHRAI